MDVAVNDRGDFRRWHAVDMSSLIKFLFEIRRHRFRVTMWSHHLILSTHSGAELSS